ncbi:MAG TPA: hypothetical protein VFW96_19955 [Thermomicrobiales bacterium]|nr:hypothetical protein [Thermomicrobiales bacterium]
MVGSDDGPQTGTAACSVPEAARRLGISERAVRKRIDRGSLHAERAGGGAWTVYLPLEGAVPPGGAAGGDGASPEVSAARYRAGPGASERAASCMSAECAAGMRTLFAEVGALYEAQLAAMGAALAAKDETIAALQARIAAAEREAETAQRNNRALAELELRRRLDPAPAPASLGFWTRLRRALTGDD